MILRKNCFRGNSMSNTHSECVFVNLVIQHAVHMCHIFSCGLPGSTIFFTLSHKRHDFRKKKKYWTQNVFWFSLQLLSETFLILRRTEQDMINKGYIGLHLKYPLFSSDCNETWILWTDFRKKKSNIKFNENSFNGNKELFRADGRTDEQTGVQTDGQICRFSQFCKHA